MCNIRLSQKALKRKILSFHTPFLRMAGKGQEEGEGKQQREKKVAGIWRELACPTASNCLPHCSTSTPSCSSSLSICPAATLQEDIFTSGVCSEPPPPPCWHQELHNGSSAHSAGSVQGEADHRLAILGSTHPLRHLLSFLYSVVSLQFPNQGLRPLSAHSLPHILQRHSDKWILPVTSHTATKSDPPKSQAGVVLLQPPAPGLPVDRKAEPTTLSIPKLLSKTQGFLQHDYKNRVPAVTLDVRKPLS